MDGSPGAGAGRLGTGTTAFSSTGERVIITGGALLVTTVLVGLATLGPTLAALASATAVYLALLAFLGRDRMAAGTMMAAFFTAPYFKGFDPSASLTFTDLFIGIAVVLFLPTVLNRRLQLPALYVGGAALVLGTGLVASIASRAPEGSLINVGQWMVVLIGLPVIYALWRPSLRMIRLLLWGYVAGHLVSFVAALVNGPLANDRYDGLTHHPNAFGEAGLMSVAILLYLFHEHRTPLVRLVVVGAGLISVQSIVMSGGRGVFLVLAVLVLTIPFVERSAVGGFVLALFGSLALLMVPFVLGIGGEGSALDRLAGGSDAAGADAARETTNSFAWEAFLQSPLIGNGYLLEFGRVHNLYLQVAASAGFFAVLGLVMVLYTLARPLFDRHPQRRLCYTAWAYVGLIVGHPGLDARTSWVPMALSILVTVMASESDVARSEGRSRSVDRN